MKLLLTGDTQKFIRHRFYYIQAQLCDLIASVTTEVYKVNLELLTQTKEAPLFWTLHHEKSWMKPR